MARRMKEPSDGALRQQLIDAIEGSGLTRYRIAKDSGCDYYTLVKFLDKGRDPVLSSVEKLASYFRMRFTRPLKPVAQTERGDS